MPKRLCVVCAKEKDLEGGKTCEKGHFVCKGCAYSGVIQDDTGNKFHSTTGLVGGRQVSFNDYNFIRSEISSERSARPNRSFPIGKQILVCSHVCVPSA
jgi:hypothetical protein